CIAPCSSDPPPFREQNCLGTNRPFVSVVSAARRVPSPAASTTAQVRCPVFIAWSPCYSFVVRWAPRRATRPEESKKTPPLRGRAGGSHADRAHLRRGA